MAAGSLVQFHLQQVVLDDVDTNTDDLWVLFVSKEFEQSIVRQCGSVVLAYCVSVGWFAVLSPVLALL